MTRTRWLPVIGVLALAPWFAEMSWGGYPFTDVPLILLFLSPLYGCAALLIREVARRTGRGWPTILLLAAAFGVLQAGVVDQSLFNPAYGRFDFQHPVHVDGIDVSLYYLLAFVTGHVVASIAAPIAVVECCTRDHARPWLGRRATWVVAVVYVLASLLNFVGVKEDEGHGFQAAPLQTAVAVATVVVLVLAAVRWRPLPPRAVHVPTPWVLGAIGFVAYLLYLPGEDALSFAVGVAVVTAVTFVVGRWSRSRRWTDDHSWALAAGTVLVGLVMPFWTEPYDDDLGAGTELTADVVAATVCALLVALMLWRRRVHDADATEVRAGP